MAIPSVVGPALGPTGPVSVHCDWVRANCLCKFYLDYHLTGQVVKASASRAADLAFDSCLCCGDFSGSSHTSVLKIGTLVATLPDTWRYRVSAGTGWPGVSIL